MMQAIPLTQRMVRINKHYHMDPLELPIGLITRSMTKKIKKTFIRICD